MKHSPINHINQNEQVPVYVYISQRYVLLESVIYTVDHRLKAWQAFPAMQLEQEKEEFPVSVMTFS